MVNAINSWLNVTVHFEQLKCSRAMKKIEFISFDFNKWTFKILLLGMMSISYLRKMYLTFHVSPLYIPNCTLYIFCWSIFTPSHYLSLCLTDVFLLSLANWLPPLSSSHSNLNSHKSFSPQEQTNSFYENHVNRETVQWCPPKPLLHPQRGQGQLPQQRLELHLKRRVRVLENLLREFWSPALDLHVKS